MTPMTDRKVQSLMENRYQTKKTIAKLYPYTKKVSK